MDKSLKIEFTLLTKDEEIKKSEMEFFNCDIIKERQYIDSEIKKQIDLYKYLGVRKVYIREIVDYEVY